jgi:DsbC/DsbD-like thiol-disulfide interchange protein
MTVTRPVALIAALVGVVASAEAQAQRPRAEVLPVVSSGAPKAGAPLVLALHVRLPKDVHVQANKPRDPSLIPTVLTLTPPAGVTVDDIVYPAPTELAQKDRRDSLAVLGPEFTIEVKLTVGKSVPAGDLTIPAVLRYQACNDTVCFPPARATTEWTLRVD